MKTLPQEMRGNAAKGKRESKSSMFLETIQQLSTEVAQLEDLASRVVGRVEGAILGNGQLSPPEQSPCPLMVLSVYPDRLRELRERILKARQEIIEALF